LVDGGRIIESGTHDSLLALGGQYKALWHRRQNANRWRIAG
jgi:ATP-binding cassette subfamily B protein